MSCQTIEPDGLIRKDPDALKVYQFDWTDYLACLGTGETIATSTMVITGADAILTQDNASIIAGSLKTQVRLLAGTPGYKYRLTNRIVTNGTPAQTDDRSIDVLIQDR